MTHRRRRPGRFSAFIASAAKARDRFSALMLLLTASSLTFVLLVLAAIGKPPRWRINALWVNKHAPQIRTALGALALAICASLLVVLWRRQRGLVLSLWLIAAAIAAACFWEQLTVITTVLLTHAR